MQDSVQRCDGSVINQKVKVYIYLAGSLQDMSSPNSSQILAKALNEAVACQSSSPPEMRVGS